MIIQGIRVKKTDNQNSYSALLALNKPLGMSSHDCVGRARRLLHMKRIGHAGTLDPDASGVLVLGVGSATRMLGLLTLDTKSYNAQIAFGTQTNTDDAQGEVIAQAPVSPRLKDEDYAQEILQSLIGTHMQVPPQFSAISINGTRSYKSARAGEHVDIPAREIEIYDAHLNSIFEKDELVWDVSFTVSKGTYIRSIARDLGEMLGTKAHLCGLIRTASGNISLQDSLTFDELKNISSDNIAEHALNPLDALGIQAYKELNEHDIQDVICGRVLRQAGIQGAISKNHFVAMTYDNKLYGIWEPIDGGYLKAKVNFSTPVTGVIYPC